MRKIISIIAALSILATALFAVSYTNNTYHKLAEEYTQKAQKALDAGYYELAEEYAAEAKKNAALSEEFIAKMIARAEAEDAIEQAKSRMEESLANGADPKSSEYTEAQTYLNKAQDEFEDEDYAQAKEDALKVKTILSDEYLAKLAEEKAAKEADAKKDAAKEALQKAKAAITAAEAAGMDDSYDVYNDANSKYRDAQYDYNDEDYDECIKKANEIVEMLSPESVAKEIADAKKAAEDAVEAAKKALEDAEKAGIDRDSPVYNKAVSDYNRAVEELENEEYIPAKEDADKVVEALKSVVSESGKDKDDETESADDDVAAAKEAAEKALADARKALEAAEEAGIDPNSEVYKQALDAYDKARDEYNNKDYDAAKADAEKVCDLLNEDLIDNLKAMTEAAKAIAAAKARLAYAENAGLDDSYPNYGEAVDYYNEAIDDFNNGKYEDAKDSAEQVLKLLPIEDIDGAVAKAKKAAEDSLAAAKSALDAAKESGMDPESDEYKAANAAYEEAKAAYDEGDYITAKEKADKVPGLLDAESTKEDKLKKQAADAIAAARERILAANNAGLDTSYDPYRDALAYYRKAQSTMPLRICLTTLRPTVLSLPLKRHLTTRRIAWQKLSPLVLDAMIPHTTVRLHITTALWMSSRVEIILRHRVTPRRFWSFFLIPTSRICLPCLRRRERLLRRRRNLSTLSLSTRRGTIRLLTTPQRHIMSRLWMITQRSSIRRLSLTHRKSSTLLLTCTR